MYLMLGDYDEAINRIRERIMLDGDNFIAHCISCGFDWEIYDPLRDDPRFQDQFQTLVAEYERRKTVNRERVQALIAEAGF